MPDIPDVFWGLTVDAGSKPTYEEKCVLMAKQAKLGLSWSQTSMAVI